MPSSAASGRRLVIAATIHSTPGSTATSGYLCPLTTRQVAPRPPILAVRRIHSAWSSISRDLVSAEGCVKSGDAHIIGTKNRRVINPLEDAFRAGHHHGMEVSLGKCSDSHGFSSSTKYVIFRTLSP